MTYNEFLMCCTLFCKTFEGKKYEDLVKECYDTDRLYIIRNIVDEYFKSYLFEFVDKKLMIYIKGDGNIYFKSTKDFLNHFKIPLEDIV